MESMLESWPYYSACVERDGGFRGFESGSREVDRVSAGKCRPAATMSRFNARYNFSRHLTGVTVQEIKEPTASMYGSMIMVSTAFSSLEALARGIAHYNKHDQHSNADGLSEIPNDDETRKARRILAVKGHGASDRLASHDLDKFVSILMDHTTNPGARKSLWSARNSGETDLHQVAYAIRNVVFHGAFAASSSGMGRPVILMLDELRSAVHESVNVEFTHWVTERYGPPPSRDCSNLGRRRH